MRGNIILFAIAFAFSANAAHAQLSMPTAPERLLDSLMRQRGTDLIYEFGFAPKGSHLLTIPNRVTPTDDSTYATALSDTTTWESKGIPEKEPVYVLSVWNGKKGRVTTSYIIGLERVSAWMAGPDGSLSPGSAVRVSLIQRIFLAGNKEADVKVIYESSVLLPKVK